MPAPDTLTSKDLPYEVPSSRTTALGFVVLWCLDEPHRVGEFLPAPARGPAVIGRGAPQPDDPGPRILPLRVRPGRAHAAGPLTTARMSRVQLVVEREGDGLRARSVGRTSLLHLGAPVAELRARPGDVLHVHNALLLLCAERVLDGPAPPVTYEGFDFGAADPFGLVGESPALWEVRASAAFAARRGAHVLVHGPSGVGKELVARALHGLSPRRGGPLVARNAATFPETLIDAELFGNRRDYPNPGMPERAGLIGDADRGALLLDELGELPDALQAHLLRVLDSGEYQRLGESRSRRSDLVLFGLTNRAPEALKSDLLARLRHRIPIPGLGDRREDVPLLARQLLRRARAQDHELLDPFFDGEEPRLTPRLVEALVRHEYTTHVRELDRLLWDAIERGRGGWLDVAQPPARPEPRRPAPVGDPDADTVRAALQDEDWVVSRAWQRLGLANRDHLRRLMRRHQIERP